jgi:DNA repair exonuclease SbcCD nuclease subunit
MRILVLNDIHLAASPPLGCRDIYVDDIKNMMLEARDYARSEQCEYTVFTGDFWHAKRNVPYGLVRWAVELLQEWPGRKLAIVGNHDLGYGGLASVPHQPIGVLFQAGVLEWLEHDLVVENDGVRVQFSPANYRDDIDHNPWNYSLERADNVTWAVKVAHGTIVPPGKPFPFHTIPMDTIPTDGMDLVLYGHPHYDAGIQTVNGCTFACFGSLGRTQRTEENLTRAMRLLCVEFNPDCLNLYELPLTSASSPADLFYEKDNDEEIDVSAALKRFVRDIEQAIRLEEGDSLDEVIALLADTVDDRAKVRLVEYLDKAGLNG